MNCKACHSQALSTFPADVRLYMNHARTLTAPPMNPGPQVHVCLNCGQAEFTAPPQWLASGWLRPLTPAATLAASNS